jgi:predicted DCC family thiol-disulfide oxidoreductase YuxK
MDQVSHITNAESWILYDGECPFCTRYVRYTRLKEAAGPVRLLDAREAGPEVDEAHRRGYDLNEGMLLKYQGQFYHGDAALHVLAVLTTQSGVFNRVNAWLYRSPSRARIAYPFLRCGRNAALRLLGRKPIERG